MSASTNSRPRGSSRVFWFFVLAVAMLLLFRPDQNKTVTQPAPKRPVAEQKAPTLTPTPEQRAVALEAELRAEPGPYIGNWHELAELSDANRLIWLVEHHPHDDVRVKLDFMLFEDQIGQQTGIPPAIEDFIRHNRVTIVFTRKSGTTASFGLNDNVPELSIDVELLDTLIRTKQGVVDAMLILHHEAQHARQYFVDPSNSTFHNIDRPWTPEECVMIWRGEIEAYFAQCALAEEWNYSFERMDCSNPKVVASDYTSVALEQRADLAVCAPVYKRLVDEMSN